MNGLQTSLPVSEIVRGAQVDLARMRLDLEPNPDWVPVRPGDIEWVAWDCVTGWNVKIIDEHLRQNHSG